MNNNNNISLITCCNNIFFDKAVDCFQDSFENNKDIRHIIYLFGDKPTSLNVPDFISIKIIPENIENLNKPFLFAYKYWAILDSLNDAEIVIYTDSANKINGSLSDIEDFYFMDSLLLRYPEDQFLIKNWTTKKCIEKLEGESFLDASQIWAGFQSYKKTVKNTDFLNRVLSLCLDESISGPEPSIENPDRDQSECKYHRNDQSILSIESLKYKIYPVFKREVDDIFGDFLSSIVVYPKNYIGSQMKNIDDQMNNKNRKVLPRYYKLEKKINGIAHYKTRSDLLEIIPKHGKILEIGVFVGDFAKQILEKAQPSHLYLVDIWQGTYGSGDKDGNNHYEIENMEEIYLGLYQKYKYYNNVDVIRSTSVAFLKSCENNFFDAVYIDGDHTAQAVYNDLFYSYLKTKNGGIIMGHDYHHGVKEAVSVFCKQLNQKVIAIADDGCPSFFINVIKTDL